MEGKIDVNVSYYVAVYSKSANGYHSCVCVRDGLCRDEMRRWKRFGRAYYLSLIVD